MFRFVFARTCLLLLWTFLFLPCHLGAQANPSAKSPSRSPAIAKPKLTPEQQRGFKLLKAARTEAAGFEPAMRSAVLWRISSGYLQLDKPQAITLLKEAFRAAGSAQPVAGDVPCFYNPPDGCQPKRYLQLEIMMDLAHASPEEAEQLAAEVESKDRKDVIDLLIYRYAEEKNLDHAEELLTWVQDEDDFPYRSAIQVMLASKSAEQRLAIFNVALRNYRNFGDPEYLGSDEDLGTMVIRFWEHLPAPSVLEAIDLLLENAKSESQKSDDNHISVSSQKGNVTFPLYEYRLFALIPVLQQLDSARAESLLREHSEVRDSLQRYPQGLKSLSPLYRDTPATDKEQEQLFAMVSAGNPHEDLAAQQANDQWLFQSEAKQREIRAEATRNPKQALQMAMALPMWGPFGVGVGSPRARNLQNVAEVTAKKDPDTATRALDELRKILEQYKPQPAATYLLQIIDDYVAMGDKERAAKTLDEGMKLAEKLYAADIDSSDPNLALKAQWPSTAFWQKLVMAGVRVSPELPEQLMSQIADQEIRTLQKAAFGLELVGAKKLLFPVIVWRKSGHNSIWSTF